MLADCIKTLVNRRAFEAYVSELERDGPDAFAVAVEASEPKILIGEVLRYQRAVRGLSVSDVTRRLGPSARREYLRYEQGRAEPSLSKFRAILGVVAPEMSLVIGLRASNGVRDQNLLTP